MTIASVMPLSTVTTVTTPTPAPDPKALVAAVLRALLQLGSGLGLAVGQYSDSQVTMAASIIVFAGSLVWSTLQKYRAARADYIGSVRSAAEGKTVQFK